MRSLTTVFAVAMLLPGSAHAALGLYTEIGLGLGKLSGSRLITEQVPGSQDVPVAAGASNCCPGSGFAFDFRLGWNFLDLIGPEAGLIGYGWALGSDNRGGSGFVGGGLRVHPLGMLQFVDEELAEFPIDIGLGAMFGYTIVGKDFAYSGNYVGLDATLEYRLIEIMSIGVRVNYFVPTYSAIALTDYTNELGRCLDSAGDQIEPNGPPQARQDLDCSSGKGPTASFFAPMVMFTFHLPL